MAHRVEARVPFLDLRLVEVALRLAPELKVRDGVEKWLLRHAFADVLPDYVAARRKNPMSHSSGLHERIRLFRPLFGRMYRSFGYHLAAPLQRDFSEVLKDHGYDLEAAAAARPARDLTVVEHARDLLGALRWNLQHTAMRVHRRERRRRPLTVRKATTRGDVVSSKGVTSSLWVAPPGVATAPRALGGAGCSASSRTTRR
jgi:asparagine synthase (glutamine-hydrolysing)